MLQTVGFWMYVVVASAIIGFAFGYFVCRVVILMHARVGSKPPFAPFLDTPLRWGLFFGVGIGLGMPIVYGVILLLPGRL